MKTRVFAALAVALLMSLTASVAAEDYSSYSTEDLIQMRDQARYMSEEDKAAYRSERQSRMESMTQEERLAMRGDNESGKSRNMSGSDKGQGTKTRSRLRDGSGGGSGKRRGGGGRH